MKTSGAKCETSLPFSGNAKLFGRRILPFSGYEEQLKSSYWGKWAPMGWIFSSFQVL